MVPFLLGAEQDKVTRTPFYLFYVSMNGTLNSQQDKHKEYQWVPMGSSPLSVKGLS
jgi:hypothetical protein